MRWYKNAHYSCSINIALITVISSSDLKISLRRCNPRSTMNCVPWICCPDSQSEGSLDMMPASHWGDKSNVLGDPWQVRCRLLSAMQEKHNNKTTKLAGWQQGRGHKLKYYVSEWKGPLTRNITMIWKTSIFQFESYANLFFSKVGQTSWSRSNVNRGVFVAAKGICVSQGQNWLLLV